MNQPMLPLVIERLVHGESLLDYVRTQRAALDETLLRHGAILFRGFFGEHAPGPEVFERIAEALCDELLDKNPEHVNVTGKVQTPVAYSAKSKLLWHNENSFNLVWPRKIIFGCETPAESGGETPLVDSRRMFEAIHLDIREEWMRKGVMYVRNFVGVLGLPWQQVFDTTNQSEVERICAEGQVELTWKPSGGLQTRAVRPAIVRHPVTGELSWFNQMQHWHVAALGEQTRQSLAKIMPEEDFPRACFFGDGSPIPEDHVRHILDLYAELEVAFPWRCGDVLLVDNVLAAHARNPYIGERRLLVALGEPTRYGDDMVMVEMDTGAI